MLWLVENMTPISWDNAWEGMLSGNLPKRAVTVTFDDGDPSIIANALPVLGEFEMSAIAYICPGLVDTSEPFWWQIVERAGEVGIASLSGSRPLPTIGQLKALHEETRRSLVSEIRAEIESRTGSPLQIAQLTTSDLRKWAGSGNRVGNHTWDHPLLDTCDAETQMRQISDAHNWLDAHFPGTGDFAYPNGNRARESEAVLIELGYRSAALFDHDIATVDEPMAMSRIRVNAHDPLPEFVAKASGLHSFLSRRRAR
jgi:peptidoglycan/xylan/chitin deacetylase (PgdA/CDA1 family)